MPVNARPKQWIAAERQAAADLHTAINALYYLKQEYASGNYAARITATDLQGEPNVDINIQQLTDFVNTADAIIAFLSATQGLHFKNIVVFRKP